jgi:hypothetical protein
VSKFEVLLEGERGQACRTEAGDGEVLKQCGNPRCVDCALRAAVAGLKARGATIDRAVLIHAAAGDKSVESEPAADVIDDLLTGKRTGTFRKDSGPTAPGR